MTRKKLDFRGQAFKDVLGFTFRHWAKQPWRIFVTAALVLLSALADVLTPMFAGRLVDAIASGSASNAVAWHAAITAFCVLGALGLGAELLRQGVFFNLIRLTLKMMSEIAGNAFHRVQRFSTDWHANSFAGSTVRKITRGMWALDLLNDTLLVALLPSLVMLVGATVLLGWRWPMMGAVVGIGSVLYIAVTVALSLGFVAPAARLANAWDTRMGGALADAVSCNGVVKAFGAEDREEALLERVIVKWRHRTRRTWIRGTINGGVQGSMLVAIQAAILGVALLLWVRGEASVGDITFALTMFFMLQGYLRDVGMHIRNLQRSVNDMEELVSLESQPLGIEDRPGAGPIAIGKGEIRFEHVTFHYGAKATPLYDNFSVRIAPGERVGLVGHSGSGKTTFIKLIQRLYDISEGRITIDGQDIARVRQASLRSQIAIVQQEPVLFHRSLAENIAYARPDASRAEIERAAKLASAHGFISALPQGYDTLVGERGIKLSGGERQRVAIARAFLADAPILILDEATSSLDSESEVLIQQAMERLMMGRTTLVVAHRLSTVRALDRLLVLDKGKVIEEGSHEALIRLENGLYRRLFERQALELIKGLGDSEVAHKTNAAKANRLDDSDLLVEK
ncbi:ABC transporter ATP-binding protein/permease [Paraburkholderia sp. SEWSISQ10-3 4]|jgi:ATP-binding cassette, subfamily B, bacterial|uniref:ATP-binding cassette, subfamily B n=1 Tax=Paraburkholderia aspalathi TaxID=1324617 RepID=A0A1I7EH04_9BURK|nr:MULTISPECIES: ABC transporter ATP-binding protein [Paraburkholderia]MCX4141381.1 ABC transporter ATP-binding protein [Paraburkholderia aspalathi]MDN7174063.1 ABC transporter ATP-binding protein/permease [Paraburkholderia sp. SEWSISQ10-3 4]MDQ6503704.1 ABC transporter ATP-binding protein/permease [Paraburkholderia aspalathi]SFU23224.1 ATP-binding cassette, subfamily B [Paraburkholderia aspalathi]